MPQRTVVPPANLRMGAGAWLVVATVALVVCGCADSQRQPVEGTVTFDGSPLESGTIMFIPEQGTSGPTAGARIENGKFSIAPEGSVFAGKFRVTITATRPSTTNKVFDYETRQMVIVPEQFIPKRYNDDSELVVDVDAGGTNNFDFPLTSK